MSQNNNKNRKNNEIRYNFDKSALFSAFISPKQRKAPEPALRF